MKSLTRKFKKYYRYYWNNIEVFKTFECGSYGVKTSSNCVLTIKHFENLIKLIKFFGRKQRLKLKFWFFITPNYFVTRKAKGLRMGRGKGTVSHKIVYVNAGKVIFNVMSFTSIKLENLLKSCVYKLPGKCFAYSNNVW